MWTGSQCSRRQYDDELIRQHIAVTDRVLLYRSVIEVMIVVKRTQNIHLSYRQFRGMSFSALVNAEWEADIWFWSFSSTTCCYIIYSSLNKLRVYKQNGGRSERSPTTSSDSVSPWSRWRHSRYLGDTSEPWRMETIGSVYGVRYKIRIVWRCEWRASSNSASALGTVRPYRPAGRPAGRAVGPARVAQ